MLYNIFMDDKQKIPEQLKNDILNVLVKHLDLTKYSVFLFGSRAEGQAHARSDFDVGIEGTEALPSKTLLSIEEDIEKISTLYTIQIVDFKRTSLVFNNIAKQYMVPMSFSIV